jgi:hypothetical protein
VPNYPHGGGTVAYQDGTTMIGAGAVSAQGPCPPEGEHHDYQWTVQALDGAGIGAGLGGCGEKVSAVLMLQCG